MPRLRDLAPSVLERSRKQGKGKLLAVPYCLSGGFVANVLAVVNVALYLTYGSTCVASTSCSTRNSRRTSPESTTGSSA